MSEYKSNLIPIAFIPGSKHTTGGLVFIDEETFDVDAYSKFEIKSFLDGRNRNIHIKGFKADYKLNSFFSKLQCYHSDARPDSAVVIRKQVFLDGDLYIVSDRFGDLSVVDKHELLDMYKRGMLISGVKFRRKHTNQAQLEVMLSKEIMIQVIGTKKPE